jgi:hypothetical protein
MTPHRYIDQIVVGVGKECRPLVSPGPLSRRVGRRHELRLDLGRCAESRLIEGCQIVLHRPAGGFAIALLVPLLARDRALTVGVGLDQAGIDSESLATDQAGLDAGPHDAFEDVAEEIALAKALGARTEKAE